MADFSVQATRMPDAQNNVARDIVSPVHEQAMQTNIVPVLGTVTDMLMKGFDASRKADMEAQRQAVVGGYARDQQLINDGIASGEIRPDRAATQSRALFGKYLAGYSVFADDLHKINNAMRSGSEMGQAEESAKAAIEAQKAREASARSNGVTLYPWMDPATKEVMLQGNEFNIRAEKDWKQKQERSAEQRAVSADERAMLDRDRKEGALQVVTDLAGSHLNTTSAFIQDMAGKVSQGKIPFEDAQVMMTQHFATIEATIQSASGLNPEIAAPYRTLFADLKALGSKAIDPKTNAETSKALFDELMYKAKLVAVTSDPALKATVVANSLMGGNAVTVLKSLTPITNYIDKASRIDSSMGEGYVPPIVGNPDVEKDVLSFLKSSIQKVNEGGYKENDKAGKEATKVINNVLKQTADLQNDSTVKQSPEKLADLAKFFASSEYGTFVSKGTLNKQAAQAAKQVWQSTYDPAVRQSIQQRLDTWESSLASKSGGGVQGAKLSEALDVKYDGSGISFIPKTGKVSLEPYQQRQQEAAVAELNSVKAGINQSIHIGAHMEGHTDYNKYWEANKHLYVPQLYPAPAGTIVNGYKYKGGTFTDPSNWTKVE